MKLLAIAIELSLSGWLPVLELPILCDFHAADGEGGSSECFGADISRRQVRTNHGSLRISGNEPFPIGTQCHQADFRWILSSELGVIPRVFFVSLQILSRLSVVLIDAPIVPYE